MSDNSNLQTLNAFRLEKGLVNQVYVDNKSRCHMQRLEVTRIQFYTGCTSFIFHPNEELLYLGCYAHIHLQIDVLCWQLLLCDHKAPAVIRAELDDSSFE